MASVCDADVRDFFQRGCFNHGFITVDVHHRNTDICIKMREFCLIFWLFSGLRTLSLLRQNKSVSRKCMILCYKDRRLNFSQMEEIMRLGCF